MTQASRPNADHIANYPTSDAGPYSRDQWAELFYILFTGDQQATQGPFMRYLNELEVTNPAGVTIRVGTGAGMCTGTGLINSAIVDFTPTTPLVGDRIDKVVMCLNNTNATYNTNLEFPAVLTDYDGTASIEPYSCRLAILTGEDGGATRVLVQTANYFMVELARYTITMAPAISVGPTDYRVFCHFSTGALYRRQGGSATNWATTGTVNYTPGATRMQAGSIEWVGGAAVTGFLAVTFPRPFADVPLIFTGTYDAAANPDILVIAFGTIATGTGLTWRNVTGGSETTVPLYWLAIGP